MSNHVAFVGVTVDHLYSDCPTLARTQKHSAHVEHGGLWVRRVGDRCVDLIDPEGSDVCGLCYRRWKR